MMIPEEGTTHLADVAAIQARKSLAAVSPIQKIRQIVIAVSVMTDSARPGHTRRVHLSSSRNPLFFGRARAKEEGVFL